MNLTERKAHWEKIYQSKALEEVSWYQPNPEASLAYVQSANLDKDAQIIDVGAGDSFLVDYLLDQGYEHITVLDISEAAIARAKKRLGNRAELVNWVVSDVVEYNPEQTFDFWHDRAAFHFLTNPADQEAYAALVSKAVKSNGKMLVATFSDHGPTKCSGIEIQQYEEEQLAQFFSKDFSMLSSQRLIHPTPFATEQEFLFAYFEHQ